MGWAERNCVGFGETVWRMEEGFNEFRLDEDC